MWFDPAQLAKAIPLPLATFATSATFQTQKPMQGPKVAIVAKVASLACPKTDFRSRSWLLRYPDHEPVEVASFTPATHAEILERHPDAIAAEPFNPTEPEPARACSTCNHVTGRGGCGEPVAAGLSDVVGVIRYSPDQGATCRAWMATIPDDPAHEKAKVQSCTFAPTSSSEERVGRFGGVAFVARNCLDVMPEPTLNQQRICNDY